MIRAITIAMLLCAGSLRAPGQSGFIVQFNDVQTGLSGYGHSVREVEDGYLIFGHQVSADPLGRTHCVIFKVDHEGEFQWRKELAIGFDHDYNWGVYDPVASLDTGGFAAVIHRFNGGLADEYRLYWFNDDGDSTGTLNIGLPIINSPYGGYYNTRQTRQLASGGLIVTGSRNQSGSGDSIPSETRAMLFLLDQGLDTLWAQTYGTVGASVSGYSVSENAYGGYYLGGKFEDGGNMDHCLLISVDGNGNELWRRRFGGRSFTEAHVRARPNGHAITYSSYGEVGWPLSYRQYLLTEWDENGDTVWESRSHYGYWSFPGDLELLSDGSVVTVGEWYGLAQLAKFDNEGDSLWSRSYEVTNTYHWAYDVQPSSDGGFVATGYANQGADDPSPGVEVIWVLKTDSLGCVVPGCQNVGVQEYAMDLQNLLRVSPNPASDVVQVALELPEGGEVEGRASVQLLDATGRLVLEQVVQQNLNQLRATLDVSALPKGTYYLHLRDARRWLAGSKVVVE